ncbi:MAG TPA: type II 3-dehydroquinate dehydratase [Thiohalobacter sp.]|nr:type II 3-dehydroquinate dehydratase [Thiohalobacter sp.]
MPQVLVINGPNLNLLGSREPDHYGGRSLEDISAGITALAGELGADIDIFQSNAEHELVGRVQAAQAQADFIILNPAAFTHTSVALRDALLAVDIPFIEVHLSNVHAREAFRAHSYFSDIALGVISGLGPIGYELALRAAHDYLSRN